MKHEATSEWHLDYGEGVGIAASTDLALTGRLSHGVTQRCDGLNLSFRTEPDPARVRAARQAVCHYFGVGLDALVVPEQVHGAEVARVGAADAGRGAASPADAIPGADALVTATPGLLLGITIADCLPVFLFDPVTPAIGLAHAGWRGTVGRIVPRTLELMRTAYGTDPGRVLAAIGPGIGGRCYEVGREVHDAACDAGIAGTAFAPSRDGHWRFDLQAAVQAQLIASAVAPDAISVAPWCTHCAADLFFSHRRDGAGAGRMGAFIRLEEAD